MFKLKGKKILTIFMLIKFVYLDLYVWYMVNFRMEEDTSVYHEKQQLQLCALHVLNNLLQEQKAFTKADLDQICNK